MRTLSLFLLTLLALPAQPLVFERLIPASSVTPAERFDGTIAYDAPGRQLFLFGGQDTQPRNDLWAFSMATREWTALSPSGTKPPARSGHTTVFDAQRRRLIVFGGQASGFFSDVWAYDIAGNRWDRLAADEAGPSRRYGHSAILEPGRDRMIISHGFTNSGRFDDTWAFELAANRWRNISPSSGRPLRRCLHHAVLDEANGQMLLFGGCASGAGPCPLDDLWAFDLATNRWTERTVQPRPPAREHYGRSFDSKLGRMIVFGGGGRGNKNDVWLFDPRANRWEEAPIAGAPSPRSRHESAYSAESGATFFFGGFTDTGISNELWMLSSAAKPVISNVSNAFSGDGEAVSPGELISIYGTDLAAPVRINGSPATIFYTSPGQINARVPEELEGSTEARITAGASESKTVPVRPAHPGLFPALFHADFSINSPSNPATPGGYIILFVTGHGLAAEPRVLVDGSELPLTYAGPIPGIVGVLQINLRLPDTIPAGAALPVSVTVGGQRTLNQQLFTR